MNTAGGPDGFTGNFVSLFVRGVLQEKSVGCYVQDGRRINPLELRFARLLSGEDSCIRKKRFKFTSFQRGARQRCEVNVVRIVAASVATNSSVTGGSYLGR